ncbi:hypothetical protein [Maribacter sp. 2307ULW6-5]|uniref:hypothetical protein n=1 Tax=Maribacter sp. 2307ULW6-5 TaxID=3386275 RepID=UPI0039BCE648
MEQPIWQSFPTSGGPRAHLVDRGTALALLGRAMALPFFGLVPKQKSASKITPNPFFFANALKPRQTITGDAFCIGLRRWDSRNKQQKTTKPANAMKP